ncbi:MAG: ATP-binding cassette domain-containing protein [Candidatus Nanopelagicales bacterium]
MSKSAAGPLSPEVRVAEVIHFADVSVRRGQSWLLKNVDWVVRENERWVIIGPNGAGKSTLLRLAAALMHPTLGVAVVLDEYLGLTNVFELRPRIGLVGAGFADSIPPTETVENLVVTASWAVSGRGQEVYAEEDLVRARRILGSLGLDRFAARTYGTLSEGERKRSQIARALMTDPELMLLDEPAAGLDLGGREQLLSTLSNMMTDPFGSAVVLVTHHVEEIPPGTTHALVMADGRVVAQGPIGDVLTASVLEQVYGLPLVVSTVDGRWSARAARSAGSA